MKNDKSAEDQEKFKEAGEQAARVVGEFFSMASEFSRRVEKNFDSRHEATCSYQREERKGDSNRDKHNDVWHREKDTLHEAGDAVGAAIDGFANGFRKAGTTNAVGKGAEWSGQRSAEWMEQASELLKQQNPADFFDKLKTYCDPLHTDQQHTQADQQQPTARQQKLTELFADKEVLDELTERQFEELFEFMQSNYKSVLQLVSKK